MYWKVIFLSALVVLACCAVPVSATDFSDTCKETVFSPWYNYTENPSKAPPIYGSVTQGSTKTYSYFIPASANRLEISLSWNQVITHNDLSLRIIDPTTSYGPYYDNYENTINGIIPITSIGDFMKGCWWNFEVYGCSVSGTQPFNLVINAI